jgi:transposase
VIAEVIRFPRSPVVSLSQLGESLSFPGDAGLGVLLPHLAGLVVEEVVVTSGLVCCRVRSAAAGACCPGCGTWSGRVHDVYQRRLADAGIGGRRVVLSVVARRLACGSPQCPKGTFAERFPLLAGPRARKTLPLAAMLGVAAVALCGRAGARLSRALLAAEVSRHSLVRLVMAVPDPPAALVRVLGVDDFSLRRGQSYATVLVDMEAGVPVDVLPGREAATLEAWLRDHPGTQVVCRDRASAYAEAARNAAPGAVQVADRWHLWHNLCDHARDAVARHRHCLAGHCSCGTPRQQAQRDELERKRHEEETAKAAAALEPAAAEARIRARHAEIAALRAAGLDLPAAAARLGLQLRTARQYWDAPSAAALLAGLRPAPGLDPWKPFLRAQQAAGTTSITALHTAITAQGYTGAHDSVRRYLAPFRLAAPGKPPAPPTPRQATRWITSPGGKLTSDEATALAILTSRCPDLAALKAHVTAFAQLLTRRQGKDALDAWLTAAGNNPALPELASFTNGIRTDYDAVTAALTLTWSSGLVEGLNTRTKLLKRQMYGRASFPLLRKRILTATQPS